MAQARSFGEFKNAGVVNDARADVTAMQRNDPDPPTASEEMVRGPFACSAATVRIIGKTLAPLVAVPLFHAGEPRPDGVDRMLRVRTKMSKFPSEHGSAPCSIDDPTSANSAVVRIWRAELRDAAWGGLAGARPSI